MGTKLLIGAAVAAAAAGALFIVRESRANPPMETLRFRDYSSGLGTGMVRDLASPIRTHQGQPATPPVVSKWNQPRDVGPRGTTPHQGADLRAAIGTPVYPVLSGWVLYQDGRYPGGTCCVSGHAGPGSWELLLRLDWNSNGRPDDNVFLKYDHLERVGFVPDGTFVTPADRIATSGNENGAYAPHLHFGLLFPRESTANTGRWTSLEPHYTWAGAWRNGQDLDFISRVGRRPDNVVEATAYVISDGNRISLPAGRVTLFHRRESETHWSSRVMSASRTQPDRYWIDLDALGYPAGTAIRWMVSASRPNLHEAHPAAFYPPGPAHADNDPNAVSFAYPAYAAVTN